MTIILVKPSTLEGQLTIPTSKSQTLRAMIFATLAKGVSEIHHPLNSPDTDAMEQACKQLGAEMLRTDFGFRVTGTGCQLKQPDDVIHAGNSGIVLRFVGGLASLIEGCTIFTGDHSIRHSRPAQPLLDGINQLGGKAYSTRKNGQAPFVIHGRIKPGTATIEGQDSQPISALLIAASCLEGSSEIIVKNAGEKPWINLTLQWLQKMGAECRHQDFERFAIKGSTKYNAFNYVVPGDWSTAAFPFVAAIATRSKITLDNLDFEEAQGDKKIVDWIRAMGGSIDYSQVTKQLTIDGASELRGMDIDINDCIDALPALAAISCFATSPVRIHNAAIARRKESDRIAAMAKELIKMGVKVEETLDGIIIHPSKLIGSSDLRSHADHRIALALAAASLGAEGPSRIHDAECISKTYPNFYSSWQNIGAKIHNG